MEITHLRVILDAERVLLVSTDTQTQFIHGDNPISRGALKHMEFNKGFFGSWDYLEFWETHLEHHIGFVKHNLLTNHHESASSGTNISKVKFWVSVLPLVIMSIIRVNRWAVFNLAMSPGDKTLRNHNVIGCTMPTECSPVLPYDIDIIQKLSLHRFENEDFIIILLLLLCWLLRRWHGGWLLLLLLLLLLSWHCTLHSLI